MLYLSLYNYIRNTGTGCFDEMLFALFNKADQNNLMRLTKAFPEHAIAWANYYHKGVKWLEANLGKEYTVD